MQSEREQLALKEDAMGRERKRLMPGDCASEELVIVIDKDTMLPLSTHNSTEAAIDYIKFKEFEHGRLLVVRVIRAAGVSRRGPDMVSYSVSRGYVLQRLYKIEMT